jgi:CrcB protein
MFRRREGQMNSQIWLVMIGGFFGAMGRLAMTSWVSKRTGTSFPYGTLTVNMVGSILLGFLYGWTQDTRWIALAGAGFLGAFTTFSTFAYEIVGMKEASRRFLYIGVSIIGGIGLAALGFWLGGQVDR